MRTTLLLLIGAVALSGCALLNKNDPHVPRYFTPEYDGDAPAARVRSDLRLRLGRGGFSGKRRARAARPARRRGAKDHQ